MSDFPASAEEFYALRDDRTNRCSGSRSYQRTSCAVCVSEATAATPAGQVMVLAAANLLSRWCRRVTIVLPPTSVHPLLRLGIADLGELILAQMRDADPFGDFVIKADGAIAVEIALGIGEDACFTSNAANVFINASGWHAAVSLERPFELPPTAGPNWLGAIAAACLGVGQAFKIALHMPAMHFVRNGVFDLFQLNWSHDNGHASWPPELHVGNVLMVGAGSVGSAAAYCMRFAGLAGSITIVDKDRVKVENLNRSAVFGRGTVGLTKADAVARFLASSALTPTPVDLWWHEFLKQRRRSSFDFDVWLPLANEGNVRLGMQHNVPPLMVHASTTANWGVNHGRHMPGRDDCLADRFPTEVSAESLTCATAEVVVLEAGVDAALPFASLFAGLLVAADLVRAQLSGYPQVPNFALFDWFGTMESIQAWDRKPRPGCICQDQGVAFHDQFNGRTRYRNLFRFE
ncbi:MAG: ThiF family adenylyltransferase [Acidobacteria bacterium]|nr:ThiF family adenylyltransferase [Acidobacteriota bacterium]